MVKETSLTNYEIKKLDGKIRIRATIVENFRRSFMDNDVRREKIFMCWNSAVRKPEII